MSDRVVVGRVGRPHGLDGSFVVEGASDDPRWFKVGAKLLVGDGELEVVGARRARGRPVIRLDREAPRGASLEVPREALPPTGEDEYYTFQLVGLEVVEENGRALGSVADVLPGVANDVLQVGDSVLLPMIEDCILSVDLEARRIVVAEGFAL